MCWYYYTRCLGCEEYCDVAEKHCQEYQQWEGTEIGWCPRFKTIDGYGINDDGNLMFPCFFKIGLIQNAQTGQMYTPKLHKPIDVTGFCNWCHQTNSVDDFLYEGAPAFAVVSEIEFDMKGWTLIYKPQGNYIVEKGKNIGYENRQADMDFAVFQESSSPEQDTRRSTSSMYQRRGRPRGPPPGMELDFLPFKNACTVENSPERAAPGVDRKKVHQTRRSWFWEAYQRLEFLIFPLLSPSDAQPAVLPNPAGGVWYTSSSVSSSEGVDPTLMLPQSADPQGVPVPGAGPQYALPNDGVPAGMPMDPQPANIDPRLLNTDSSADPSFWLQQRLAEADAWLDSQGM